jgi:hypothetical protein
MRFSVNAAALPGLAALTDRRSQDLTASSAYVAQHTQIDWGNAGILNLIWGHHRDILRASGSGVAGAGDGAGAWTGTGAGDGAGAGAWTGTAAAAAVRTVP